jgi:hypothetical protein
MPRVRNAALALLASVGLSCSGYFVANHLTAGANTSRTAVTGLASPSAAASTNVLFDDEFESNALDLSNWRPNWLGGNDSTITKPINGAEASCYDPAQVNVPGDGFLHLSAAHRACRASNGHTYSYASGLVESDGHFTFTDGYLEARVWLPGSSSIVNWPAVWTNGTGTWPATGESDIMEGLSGKACYHYHSPSGGPGGCPSGSFTGWHTFAEEVSSGTVTYYYDGTRVGSERSVVAPHYIVLNLGVGGFGGAIAAPSEMLVDYVRVTRHKSDAVGDPTTTTTTTSAPPTTTTTSAAATTTTTANAPTTTTTTNAPTTTTTDAPTTTTTGAPTTTTTANVPAPAAPPGAGTRPASHHHRKGSGYWTVDAAGNVRPYGRVAMRGDLSDKRLASPVVAAARTADGGGYWLVSRDGGVFAFGNAKFLGSMAGRPLAAPIVAFTATHSGRGYYLVGADGGVFAFGDARFFGSTGSMRLHAPIRDIALSRSGKGYWIVGSDGGVFSFGDAAFRGSASSLHLSASIVSLTAGQHGYWLVSRDGGIFAFGVPFHGSLPAIGARNVHDARRIRALSNGSGYYIFTARGGLYTFGSARYFGTDTAWSVPEVDLVVAPLS